MDWTPEPAARVVHAGEGPYPHPCDFCGEEIEARERYVLKDDASVLHETCDFFAEEDAPPPPE